MELIDIVDENNELTGEIWLENFLIEHKGTILLISHDRYFASKISEKEINLI